MKSVDMLREWSRRYDNNWIDPKTGEMTVFYGTTGDCLPSGEYERFSLNEGETMRGILDEIEREREQRILAMLDDAPDDDWYVDHADDLAKHGWIRLPVDADGEVIRIGDVMDTEHFGTVEVEGFVHRAVAFYNYCGQLAFICTAPANTCHHHHEPTVEEVMQEMLEQAVGYSDAHTTVALNAIAEYSAKFRLADDGEEQ